MNYGVGSDHMDIDDIDFSNYSTVDEIKELRSEFKTEEEKGKLMDRFTQYQKDKKKEPEQPEPIKDTWQCSRCEHEFKMDRGKRPLVCPSCEKSSKKTVFVALSGLYQFFDMEGRNRFIPMKLANKIMEDDHFLTRKDSKEVYRFKGNFYELGAEDYIKKRAQYLLDIESVENRKLEVLNHIKLDTLVEPEEVDKDPHLIAVENGVLNTLTKELIEEPDPEKYYLTQKVPVEYDPTAKFEGSKIEQFLKEIFYIEDLPTIKRFLGTVFLKNYDWKKALVLKGQSNSGKSTALELFTRLIGKENISEQSLQKLANYPFSKGNLMGKIANVKGDLDTEEVKSTGVFKELTGGDPVNAPQKHIQGDKSFTNFAKLIFSCNRLPHLNIRDIDQAFWNRWLIVQVDKNIFNPRGKDTINRRELMQHLTQPEELSGFLNWCLEGLDELREERHFKESERTLGGKESWISDTDNLRAFVNRHIETDPDGLVVRDDFYQAYTSYCEKKEWVPEDKGEVTKELPKIEGTVKKKRPKIHYGDSHKQIRCWAGIRFKEGSPFSELNRSVSNRRSPEEERKAPDQATLFRSE